MPPAEVPLASTSPGRRSREERVFLGVIVGLVLLGVVGGVFGSRWRGPAALAGPARQLADFTLTDRTGRTIRRADLAGQYLVVNFVFTSCSLPCLKVNEHMAALQQQLADQPDVRLVSFTVDPRTDTPPVLARFANRFGADTNRWLFLTGDRAAVTALLETSFPDDGRRSLANPVTGAFVHTDRIALIDPRGQIRDWFDGLKPSVTGEVARALAQLRRTAAPQGS